MPCRAIGDGAIPRAAPAAAASPAAAPAQAAAPTATYISDPGGISGFELLANDQSPNPSKSVHWWYTKGINGYGGEFPNFAAVKFRSTPYGANRALVSEAGPPPISISRISTR
ncbi:MAG TPA: hypothetical protein VD886_11940 [Herpetosiphonaceae bacterium]|nr:hypothetical protein [Herpetosiphonaceae bacterium]